MPRLLAGFIKTPEARRRIRAFTVVVFVLLAAISWWSIATEGPTPARVISAVASTIVAVLEAFVPKRRGLLRMRARAENADGESEEATQEDS